MSKKRITKKWYSKDKFLYNHKIKKFEIIHLDNNCLFSNGIYPTKITPKDLTDDFVYGRFYKRWGYLSASGIKDLLYIQSRLNDEGSIKYDSLYISYNNQLNRKAIFNHDYENENYDFIIDGIEIIHFLEKVLSLNEYRDTFIYESATTIKNIVDKKLRS